MGARAIIESCYMINPWKRKQKQGSFCDLEFPKNLALGWKCPFQAVVVLFKESVLSKISQPVSRMCCFLLPVSGCCN